MNLSSIASSYFKRVDSRIFRLFLKGVVGGGGAL